MVDQEMVPKKTAGALAKPADEPWNVLASSHGVALGQSHDQYIVWDAKNTFGAWPLTDAGYGFASKTYEAHSQSLSHGIAYSATGYQDPVRLGLPTDAVIKSESYSSPLSYVGSTRRILGWAKKAGERSPAYNVLVWIAAAVALLTVWSFLVVWYFIIFVVFGIFVIPYRFIRRSQRKALHVQKTTLATQQAMFQQMSAQQQGMGTQPPARPPVIEGRQDARE